MTDLDTTVRAIVREEILQAGMTARTSRGISVREAAQRLSVDPKTVRRLVQRGELRAVRVGSKTLRILASDIDALLAQAEATP